MHSIWTQHGQIRPRNPLEQDLEADVAVIGAGMAGILIADALQHAGRRVVVLEADRIGSGQTRNTTAKITSQHGMCYRRLLDTLGPEMARQYAQANQAAVQAYRERVTEAGIDCDLEERDAYLFGTDADSLRAEAEAARSLGLPASTTVLPASGLHAVKFAHQAQFHPLKFLQAVSEDLTIFEKTPVRQVDGSLVITDHGTIRSEQIVFACHAPFVNFPGFYFARMHQQRSYVLALENVPQVDGMFLGADEPSWSFRNAGDLLLLGGSGHRAGENREGGQYDALRQKAREWFPGSREVACWSAQDGVTLDHVPYIGPYAAGRPGWYVATGFQKWGMTTSMVSAMVLRDLLCGRDSPYGEVFRPGRFPLSAVPALASEVGHSAKGLLKRFFQIPTETAAAIPPGHGGVVFLDGKKVGVYKEENGTVYAVDIRCPHLGCQLEWDPEERSWDCPCHGSRFDYQGRLLSGPAQEGLRHG